MTREELIAYGEDYLRDLTTAACDISEKHKEFVKMAIAAIKTEPCEDAVSREAVLWYVNYIMNHGMGKQKSFKYIKKYVEKLPPVTPKQKTGKWLKHPTEEDYSVCSHCGIGCKRMEHGKNADGTKYIDIYSYKFCPWCGAKMKGESE